MFEFIAFITPETTPLSSSTTFSCTNCHTVRSNIHKPKRAPTTPITISTNDTLTPAPDGGGGEGVEEGQSEVVGYAEVVGGDEEGGGGESGREGVGDTGMARGDEGGGEDGREGVGDTDVFKGDEGGGEGGKEGMGDTDVLKGGEGEGKGEGDGEGVAGGTVVVRGDKG